MNDGKVSLGIEQLINSVIGQADQFIEKDTGKIGLGLFLLIFVFHLVEGAAELVQSPGSSRIFRPGFWLRIFMVLALLGGYRTAVVGTMNVVQPRFMTAFATRWVEVWVSESDALEAQRKAQSENEDVKYAEVGGTKAGKDDDSWYAKLARYVADQLLTGLGWAVATLTGLFITLLILMEGFWALGVNMLLAAIGPICVAFLGHEKTEGIFWAWVKTFLLFGLLYLPMLGLGAAFAGVVMARMTTMATNAGLVYGDGSDFGVHVVSVVLGPLCAFAVVKAVPHFIGLIVGSSPIGGAGGGSFGAALGAGAVAGRLAVGGAGAGGGEGAPTTPAPGAEDKPDGGLIPILDANEPRPEGAAAAEDSDVRGQP
jgi:hypothetical protein